jgi:hypothetical protein
MALTIAWLEFIIMLCVNTVIYLFSLVAAFYQVLDRMQWGDIVTGI